VRERERERERERDLFIYLFIAALFKRNLYETVTNIYSANNNKRGGIKRRVITSEEIIPMKTKSREPACAIFFRDNEQSRDPFATLAAFFTA